MNIRLQTIAPDASIAHFVQSFWALENVSERDIEATILPDGMIDLFLHRPPGQPLQLELKGLDTEPSEVIIPQGTKMFAIGFKLPAVEYLFHTSIAAALNRAQNLDNGFWPFESCFPNKISSTRPISLKPSRGSRASFQNN
ncbi:MAG TPA: DUF6597 domain-containing transcriptional factor [Puia sp.]